MKDLTNAIRDALASVKEHDDALAKYEGYEWGYHGHREREAMDKSVNDLEETLRGIIRQELDRALSDR